MVARAMIIKVITASKKKKRCKGYIPKQKSAMWYGFNREIQIEIIQIYKSDITTCVHILK